MDPIKIYCEHSALTPAIRVLQRAGQILLIYFPYDPHSRTPYISPTALPSAAQYRDMNLKYGELQCRYGDFRGSSMFPKILEIVGPQNRRDALHVDSAYKSECRAIVTRDSDILKNREHLETLLGLRVINPDTDHDTLLKLLDDGKTV